MCARGINCRTSGTCTAAVVRGGSVIMPEEPTAQPRSSRPRKWKKYNWLSYDRERLPKVSSSAACARDARLGVVDAQLWTASWYQRDDGGMASLKPNTLSSSSNNNTGPR
uniref:(northern house mosquito) hypothetical protein n=1 Tax=Culex pipiens TaxID=7175 RepID=A0A8D7ZVG0_CULPI